MDTTAAHQAPASYRATWTGLRVEARTQEMPQLGCLALDWILVMLFVLDRVGSNRLLVLYDSSTKCETQFYRHQQ